MHFGPVRQLTIREDQNDYVNNFLSIECKHLKNI